MGPNEVTLKNLVCFIFHRQKSKEDSQQLPGFFRFAAGAVPPPRRGIPEGHSAIGFVCGLPESPAQEDRENERDNLAILVPWNCLMGVWGKV